MVRKKALENFIVIDLTTHSVKALGFEKESNKFNLESVSEGVLDPKESVTINTIKHVVSECNKQSGKKYKEVILGLSGEHVFGFLLIVKNKREKATKKITEKELEQLYTKIKVLAFQQAKSMWDASFAYEVDLEILDLVVTTTMIDDQHVEDPVGVIGSSISIAVYCSFADKKHYEWATKLVSKAGLSIFETTTTLYSQSRILAELEENFIIADVGRMYTDIGIVFGRNLIETKSFDIGGDYFTKHLEKEKNIDYAKANAKKESFADGTLEEDEIDQIGDLLFEAGKTWVLGFKTMLASLSSIKSFPTTIYLTGGSANLSVIKELLYENKWLKEIPFLNEPEVKVVDKKLLERHINDKIKVVQGVKMFATSSLAIIKKEIV